MRRLIFLCALCIALSGCGVAENTADTDSLAIDTSSIAQNTETIEKILADNVWNYDKDSMSFGNDFLIAENENFDLICDISDQAGIDTAALKKGSKQTMLASVRLTNADMTDAGTAYFAFSNRKLLCGFYIFNDAPYSLANKYPFEYEHPFSGAENTGLLPVFSPTDLDTVFDSAAFADNGEAAVISGSAIVFYKEGKNSFKRNGDIDFGELAPADIALKKGKTEYMCVLLDSYKTAERLSESDFEDYDRRDEILLTGSKKIVFIDGKNNAVLPELPLDLSIYTSVAFDGDNIAAARNSAIDIFAYENGAWVKKQRLSVENPVQKLRIADIDGNGVNEYIISDGINIGVYKKDVQLRLAWSTKFQTSRIKDIYISDLNGDGIKEIYANELYSDNSAGFALRYILCKDGFEVSGGNIVSGASAYYAIGDMNGDGKDDYIVVNNEKTVVNHSQK